jgi:replicative DNA helicase
MMIMRHNVKVCVVDYLQLIGTDGQERDSRERIVAGMSRLLKVTAKETGCCIIALSQLNEAGELRESRAIEQDADVVLYVIDNEDGDVFLRVTKQRGGESHGPMKRLKDDDPGIPLRWHKENFRFSEL